MCRRRQNRPNRGPAVPFGFERDRTPIMLRVPAIRVPASRRRISLKTPLWKDVRQDRLRVGAEKERHDAPRPEHRRLGAEAPALERALDALVCGRLCAVDVCLSPARVVLTVRRRHRLVDVSVCARHAASVGQPGGVVLAPGWQVVRRRRRRPGEIIDGPTAGRPCRGDASPPRSRPRDRKRGRVSRS